MDFNNYQELAMETRMYPLMKENVVYPALGLVGEACEVAEKIKKHWRKTGEMHVINLSHEDKLKIKEEMGDTLWYLAALCEELSFDFQSVAISNLVKLDSRMRRGVIKGEGDNR